MRRLLVVSAVVLTALGATACTPAPAVAPKPEASGCTPGTPDTLPDGRWFVMASKVESGKLDFDLVCYFRGDSAATARSMYGFPDGPYSVWVPNGYYVRNTSGARRSLAFGSGATITMRNLAGTAAPSNVSVATFDNALGTSSAYYPAWITTKGGKITGLTTAWFSTPVPTPDASGCAPGPGLLPDGRWYVFVTAIGSTSVAVDLVCWYGGDDANWQALRDNRHGDRDMPVPNDHLVVNTNTALRQEPTTATTKYFGLSGVTPVATTGSALWTANAGRQIFASVTVSGGKVTEVRQQYVP